jgi:hypothetical protein
MPGMLSAELTSGWPLLDAYIQAFRDAAHLVLQSVHFRGHAAVHVQAAMVHALQGRDNLPLADVLSHAGEARHAAQAH